MTEQQLPPGLLSFIGQLAEPPLTMRDPIDPSAIRQFCDAVGDQNPAYTDAEYAAASARRGLIAPPAMLSAWTMPRYDPDRHAAGGTVPVMIELSRMGFTAAVAIEMEQQYFRELRLGDVLTLRRIVESISAEKITGLGAGRFLCLRSDFTDAQGEAVGFMRVTILKFKPSRGAHS
jgi:uncharacterized protein